MADFPVFQFNSSAFPLLTPQQTSPLGGVLSDAIAKRLAMAKAQSAEAEVPYAGLGKLAEVLSKSAYANAVMPQIANKAASNPAVWSQLTDDQKRQLALGSASQATGQQGTLTPVINKALEIYQKQNQPKPGLFDNLMNLFNGGNQQPSQSPNQQQMQPPASPSLQEPSQHPVTVQPSAQVQTPVQPSVQPQEPSVQPLTPDEKLAKFKQMQAQAESAGKTFGSNQENAINDLNTQYWNSTNYLSAIHEMNKTITNPVFQNIQNVPFVAQHSLGWYKNTGTPEEQELIGNFLAEQPQLIQNFVSQFRGQASKKEIDLAQGSKVSEKDMPSVMVGKQTSLTYLTELANKRQELTADIMAKEGLRQNDAFKKADKLLNGDEIRQKIHDELHPSKQETSKYYAKTIDEWHNGKQAEASRNVNGKRQLKIGNQWYQED